MAESATRAAPHTSLWLVCAFLVYATSLLGDAFPAFKASPPLAPREFHQKERLDRASRLISSRDSRTVKNGAEGVTVLERAVIAPCRVIARPSDLIRGRRP